MQDIFVLLSQGLLNLFRLGRVALGRSSPKSFTSSGSSTKANGRLALITASKSCCSNASFKYLVRGGAALMMVSWNRLCNDKRYTHPNHQVGEPSLS